MKTRIKEVVIDGRSYFYPQYLGWFKRWKGFRDYCMGYYIQDENFKTSEEAREFLKRINHKPVVKVNIYDS